MDANSLSAGATAFSAHLKLSPGATGLSKAEMSERPQTSSKAANVPRGSKSL
ncbi:hypothetical protein EXN66_Car017537 [Channa argus]|uniref:Uncharacterized protein n=1 Tax=Channa argus TaxID=215402 RepID=A0A6G1QHI2_CHAAH|nr:hypothetical protein EXN66_Car017537 [Channa argus]